MAFQREKQNVSATRLLQALADGEEIHLSRCTIEGLLDVNRLFRPAEKFNTENLATETDGRCRTVTFTQPIVFDKCVFEENTVFACPWSEPDSVAVRFEREVVFNSSVFKAQARFRCATFCGHAGFDGCSFSEVTTFKNASFHRDAKFRTVAFGGYALFIAATCRGQARFTNSHFAKGVNFSQARFLGQTDFGGVYSSSRSVPGHEGIEFGLRRCGDDESFWRFVKQSAQEAGYYQMSGGCFYFERNARLRQKFRGRDYDRLSRSAKVFRYLSGVRLLPELVFGKLLFGYGERPVRILLASAIVVVLCAVPYSQDGALVSRDAPADACFIQGLYFSTVTFTTLGYGDLYPSSEGICRQLAMAEAIAGAFLMALFVVSLTKRFSKG